MRKVCNFPLENCKRSLTTKDCNSTYRCILVPEMHEYRGLITTFQWHYTGKTDVPMQSSAVTWNNSFGIHVKWNVSVDIEYHQLQYNDKLHCVHVHSTIYLLTQIVNFCVFALRPTRIGFRIEHILVCDRTLF